MASNGVNMEHLSTAFDSEGSSPGATGRSPQLQPKEFDPTSIDTDRDTQALVE